MFRPTYFVILFAVVLCATAFPADPAKPGPGGAPGVGLLPKGQAEPAKGDLETDAQTHLGYSYSYGPTWGYYYGHPFYTPGKSGWGLRLLY